MPLLDTVVPGLEVWERHSVALSVSPQRALFRFYCLIVRPFSALIRRRWLRAIAKRA